MELNRIDLIHKEYRDHYKEYELIGSYKLFIPFYKVNMKMGYIYECELNIIEEYICKCLNLGLEYSNDILDVLGLDEEIFTFTISGLQKDNYVCFEDGRLLLAEEGRRLYENGVKHEEKFKSIEWFFDGLVPEYRIDFFGEDQNHTFKKYKEISRDENNLLVLPRTFPDYSVDRDYHALSKRFLSVLNDNDNTSNVLLEKNIINVTSFELTSDREIYYHEYLMMVFKNEKSQFKLLAFDPCGLSFIDQRVTNNIQELYGKGELDSSLFEHEEGAHQGIQNIIEVLKNYANNALVNLEEEERNEILKLDATNINSRYIMTYEIREKFLQYLKNAQESLHISSPWMNDYIVNDEFIKDIKNLLRRGVRISILYGPSSVQDIDKDGRNVKTQQIAGKLKKIGDEFTSGLLTVTHGQTHDKLLICDKKYYIQGSFNFLSYAGEGDQFFRNEGATYSEEKALIEQTIIMLSKTYGSSVFCWV